MEQTSRRRKWREEIMTKRQENKLGLTLAGLALICVLSNPARGQRAIDAGLLHDQSIDMLAQFHDSAKYAAESRPLHTWNWDLLHPWSVDTQSHPMVSEQAMRQ